MSWLAIALAVGITWSDLSPPIQQWLGGDAETFEKQVQSYRQQTARRLEEGEWDHLIYFLLQGRAFTKLPPIEPALSARDFVESGAIGAPVRARLDALLASAAKDERTLWARRRAAAAGAPRVLAEYERAMRFLYEKEWKLRKEEAPKRREQIAKLYQSRGLSSDASRDALKGVEAGLAMLPANANPHEVLVVGPGADFAPRTALRDDHAPASYQPARLRQVLPKAEVECIDVNPRVVDTAGCVEQIDIVTQRRDRRYDLIVITNVLVYLDDRQLALALANLRGMLKPGGYLLHNELRDEVEPLARSLQLPVLNARMIRIGGTDERPFMDGVVLHQLRD